MKMKNPLCVAIMVKNEESSIINCLEKVSILDRFIILDTGSTDKTIENMTGWFLANNKKYEIFRHEFLGYAESRNMLLDKVDYLDWAEYVLLLDAGDLVLSPETLISHLVKLRRDKNRKVNSLCLPFYIKNSRFIGDSSVFSRVACIRVGSGLRYKGKIHEYIEADPMTTDSALLTDKFVIFQDRKDKIGKKRQSDVTNLVYQYFEDPTDERTLKYLIANLFEEKRFEISIGYANALIDLSKQSGNTRSLIFAKQIKGMAQFQLFLRYRESDKTLADKYRHWKSHIFDILRIDDINIPALFSLALSYKDLYLVSGSASDIEIAKKFADRCCEVIVPSVIDFNDLTTMVVKDKLRFELRDQINKLFQ